MDDGDAAPPAAADIPAPLLQTAAASNAAPGPAPLAGAAPSGAKAIVPQTHRRPQTAADATMPPAATTAPEPSAFVRRLGHERSVRRFGYERSVHRLGHAAANPPAPFPAEQRSRAWRRAIIRRPRRDQQRNARADLARDTRKPSRCPYRTMSAPSRRQARLQARRQHRPRQPPTGPDAAPSAAMAADPAGICLGGQDGRPRGGHRRSDGPSANAYAGSRGGGGQHRRPWSHQPWRRPPARCRHPPPHARRPRHPPGRQRQWRNWRRRWYRSPMAAAGIKSRCGLTRRSLATSTSGSTAPQMAAPPCRSVVDRPETLKLMLADQPQLHRALDAAGLPQDGRNVTLSLATPNPGDGGGRARPRRHGRQ